jgi:hypothetical protein
MRIKILDEPVRQNIEVFLQIMRRVKQKQLEKNLPNEKAFSVWLNRETGQLFFSDIREESEFLGKKEWKQIEFSYLYEPISGEVHFLVKETGEKFALFKSDDLAPSAFRILRETMRILGELSERLKGPSDLNTKFSVLTKMTIDAGVSHADRNVIIDCWHHVDRLEAEALLEGLPIGTYLFRRDPYADILEDQLEKQLHIKVKCFTLTFSGENHKISDLTVVHVDGAWEFYDDDPSLEQKRFHEIKDLMASMKGALRYPLYHESSKY